MATQLKQTLLSAKPKESAVVLTLSGVAIMAIVSGLFWRDSLHAQSLWTAVREPIFLQGEWWRLLTALGAHADLRHFLSNSILFTAMGILLNSYFGGWVFPVSSLVIGVVTNAIVMLTYDKSASLIGASGMVYAMCGQWLALYFLTSRQLTLGQRWLRTIGFTLGMLIPATFEASTSYRTHAVGFILGVAVGLGAFRLLKEKIRAYEVWEDEPVEALEPLEPSRAQNSF